MTLETLLGCSANDLDKLSDTQLREFFQPYLTTTRPSAEQARKMEKVGETPRVNKQKLQDKQAKFAKLNELFLKQTGMRLDL